MKRPIALLAALAAVALVTVSALAQQFNLTWTAGQLGGGWYAQAGGFVELIKSKDPKFNIKVVPDVFESKKPSPSGQRRPAAPMSG